MNLEWRKSSRSTNQGGACVEVAALPGAIAIRDSKNPRGGHLTLKGGQFRTFLQQIKSSALDIHRHQLT